MLERIRFKGIKKALFQDFIYLRIDWWVLILLSLSLSLLDLHTFQCCHTWDLSSTTKSSAVESSEIWGTWLHWIKFDSSFCAHATVLHIYLPVVFPRDELKKKQKNRFGRHRLTQWGGPRLTGWKQSEDSRIMCLDFAVQNKSAEDFRFSFRE